MSLHDELERLVKVAHYPVTFAAGEPTSISRWLVRAGRRSPSAPISTEPYLEPEEPGRIMLLYEASLLAADVLERNWRYCNSDILDSFQEPNRPGGMFAPEPDKYVYAMSCVYAPQAEEALLYVITYLPSPIRVWLNGELVLAGSDGFVIKDEMLRVRFREGCNVLLVEIPSAPKHQLTAQEFVVRVQPLSHLRRKADSLPFVDWSAIADMERAWGVYPEKVLLAPGETLRCYALPRYAGASAAQDGGVRVVLERGDGTAPVELLRTDRAAAGSAAIPEGYAGVCRIRAFSLADGRAFKPVHLFVGDFASARDAALREAERRGDVSAEMLAAMREMTNLPQAFADLKQYAPKDPVDRMLEQFGQFRALLDAPERGAPVAMAEAFPNRYTAYDRRTTDDDWLAYEVILPDGYDPQEQGRYPVLFYFHAPQARNYPVDLPWIKRGALADAIVVQLPGVGRVNYADDIQTIRTIGHIVASLPADRDRLYAIGFCASASKVYRMAMLQPDLFAAISPIVGGAWLSINEPEVGRLDNLDQTAVIGVFSYENWFYNTMRNIDHLKRLRRFDLQLYSGFMHNEINEVNNTPLLAARLLREEKERYPRRIAFTVWEPWFNRSFWVRVGRIRELEKPCRVEAAIERPDRVRVDCRHAGRLELLLSRADMELDESVVLAVNDSAPVRVALPPYALVTAALPEDGGAPEVTVTAWSAELFRAAYDRIGADEGEMGLKRVYTERCAVVKPSSRSSWSTKLGYLLQNPIRDRFVYYKYESVAEAELEAAIGEPTHYVLPADARNLQPFVRQLLEEAGVRAEPDSLTWEGHAFSGAYFALLAVPNPRRQDRVLLLAISNDDDAAGEMLQFLNSFDTNPLFGYEAVVGHAGAPRGYRSGRGIPLPLGGSV